MRTHTNFVKTDVMWFEHPLVTYPSLDIHVYVGLNCPHVEMKH